jgi:hypothetical protein
MMDSLSDTFINAFSKVRKPDARFVEMGDELERFEEGLTGVERLVGRGKNRVDGESFLGPLTARPRCGLPRHGGRIPDAGVSRERDHRAPQSVRGEDA